MKREDLDTGQGFVAHLSGHVDLLVSFGGIRQGLGIPVFEFFNSISDIPCDKIFLRDFHQAWYQKGVDSNLDHLDRIVERLHETISKREYQNVCFLGNSMGGYAAILFGVLLKVPTVISFAPQSYIDKFNRFISFDRRWIEQISAVHRFKKRREEYFDLCRVLKKRSPCETKINIYYSPLHRLDKRHSERLKKYENVILHPIAEGGHSVVKVVRDSGRLRAIIEACFVEV